MIGLFTALGCSVQLFPTQDVAPMAKANAVGAKGLGYSVAAVDLDQDGFDDVLATDQEGVVYLFAGSAEGMSDEAQRLDWSAERVTALPRFGAVALLSPELNEATVLFAEGTTTLVEGPELDSSFGAAATAGDIDGDGVTELLIGAPHKDRGDTANVGAVYVYDTWTGTPEVIYAPSVPLHSFGSRLTTADLNGDGIDDLGGSLQTGGSIFVYLGSDEGLELHSTVRPQEAYTLYYGYYFGSPGDINGDGFDDLAVGIDDGVEVILGGHEPAEDRMTTTDSSWSGHHVHGAGDHDRDGFADVTVGADGVRVLFGSPAGLDGSSVLYEDDDGYNHDLGFSAYGLLDVNGDGFQDLVAGAPNDYDVFDSRGEVLVFYGSDCRSDTDQDGHCAPEDCDDTDPAVHPAAEDPCGDGIDANCDGLDECPDTADSAQDSATPPDPEPPCGCRTTGTGSWWALVLALVAAAQRRANSTGAFRRRSNSSSRRSVS